MKCRMSNPIPARKPTLLKSSGLLLERCLLTLRATQTGHCNPAQLASASIIFHPCGTQTREPNDVS
jgi:hypothetical protein